MAQQDADQLERRIPQPDVEPSSVHPVAQVRGRLALMVVALYTLAVVGIAVVAGSWLYDWSRLRILGNSSLSELGYIEFFAPTIQVETDAEAVVAPSAGSVDGQPEQAVAPTDAAVNLPPLNILLLGVDSRADQRDIPLTDSMILVTFDPKHRTAGMLSLPRDLWVPIPGFGYETKINMAYALGNQYNYNGGGPQLAKDTVGTFIGQPVQYYVRVNFRGFVELIDLIGGIDVVVPYEIYDTEYPTPEYGVTTFHLPAGAQHLDGETALKYVRTRNLDSDYARAGRQQQVIRAVADKVMRSEMLPRLLPKLPRLLYTMRSSIDTDIPMALQLELANYLSSNNPREIRQLVLDSRYGEETYSAEGAWILLPDRTKVRNALAGFFAPPIEGSSSVALGNPAWVRIEILNGTGQPGVAARTRDLLVSQGWQVVSIGDADRGDYQRTLIINYGVPEELITRMGEDLELDPNHSSLHGLNVSAPVDLRIVVGQDFLSHLD